jgi:N-acetylmuramic acid 6-phosphate etherase
MTLNTEAAQGDHAELDLYDTHRLLAILAADHHRAVAAVEVALPTLAQAIDAALPRLRAGGRLVYVGAGTPAGWACWTALSWRPLSTGRSPASAA